MPRPGQESAWDYPRPPALDLTSEHVVVRLGRTVVADTRRAVRVLETSHPPVYYVPRADVTSTAVVAAPGASSWCEFKGSASYLDVRGVDDDGRAVLAPRSAWTYSTPSPGYEAIAGYVAFYPGRMTLCTVDDEEVEAQQGDFYGGWRTSRVVGPFKGGAGTTGW